MTVSDVGTLMLCFVYTAIMANLHYKYITSMKYIPHNILLSLYFTKIYVYIHMIMTNATSVLPDNRHPTNSNLVKGICYNITYSSQIYIQIKNSRFWIWVTFSIDFSIC